MRILCAITATAALFAPLSAQAEVTSEIGIYNQYVDDDLLVLTDEPVVQAGVYIDVTDNCSADAWLNHGLSTSMGGELDLGVSCRFEVGEETEVEVISSRYFLRGVDDITELSVGMTRGPVKLKVSRYFWDNNPDATRVLASYSIEAAPALTIEPKLVYETGFGEDDIFVGGIGAEYALNVKLSLVGLVLTPLKKGNGDSRTTQASVGLRFDF